MDELINDTKVMEVLILKVPKTSLNKKRKMREAFRQNFCVAVPKFMAVDIIPPTAKRQRQCTKDLARDAYIEKTSTDSFSDEDRNQALEIQQTVVAAGKAEISRSIKYERCSVSQKCLCEETGTLVL